ncbi:ABC transporter ATP-binding protein [Streptomyces olivoreticuli]|uniref:ABC transporter ATP-binding protein n=1 Tax=Streptomyces olivoreticuli TaxID=68246 RepID=UPI00265AF5B9|nr:ABC transporter ATP-binding protein [Streptomyces olivoreticuli]WKK26618.1 ABC transporter ATP-binding protein [Streptomyces olivoreticuli]
MDSLVGGHDFNRWLLLCAGLVILYTTTEAYSDYTAGVIQARSALFLRRLSARRLLESGPHGPGVAKSGEFATQVLESATAAALGTNAAVWLGFSLAPAVVSLAALWWTDLWVGLVFTCGLPLAAWCLKSFATDSSRVIARYLEDQSEISARLTEALGGARTIAVSHTLAREVNRVLMPLPKLRRSGDTLWKLQGRATAQANLLFPLLHIAVIATAGLALGAGRITPGQMLAAAEYAAMGTGLGMSMMFVGQLARARAGAERLASVTALEPMRYGDEALPSSGGNAPSGARVEVRGATVRRGDRVILDRLDLTVAPGQVTALVGGSGSGKSTVTALLGRLLDPDAGEVLLDGVAVRRLPKTELRRQVAFAFERPKLLGHDLADAIAAGHPGTTHDDVVRAARLARAETFIDKMPDGYATELGSAAMSGGEIQRIGLARAFARPARLLLLDDATSSLDMATEHEINSTLLTAMPGTTRVVVAHRASSAAQADNVVWLEDGRVRASGTHRDLWRHPAYRAVFQPPLPGAQERTADAVGVVE